MSRRPRITYVIDDLGHGGAQRQLYLGVRTLAGHADVSVVVLSETVVPYAARLREMGVPVDVIPRRSGVDPARVLALSKKFAASRADIAHAMLDSADAYTFLAARLSRIPAVLSLRSDRLATTGGRARMLGWMLRSAHAVTVNSVAGKEFLLKKAGVRADRIHLIPNIVDVPATPRDPADVRPVIGAVGRVVAMKRIEAVIDALPVIRRAVPDARVVVVGDGPARPGLENLARRIGLADQVHFTGAVDDAGASIATFACLVVASTYEGLPNAALEALAWGVPVVAVPAGDLPRVVTDGVTGVLSRDASAEALAEAIVRALSSRELRESAAREGPRLVRAQFSPEHTRDPLLALYSALVPALK